MIPTPQTSARPATPPTALMVEKPRGAMPFTPENASQALALAKVLAASTLVPYALRNKPNDIFVVLMTGHELKLSPMQSLRTINVIDGKAVMSADLMVALVVTKRDVCRYFTLVETTDQQATYETHRVGAPSATRLTYTLEQAKRAGLTGSRTTREGKSYTSNYEKHPAAMLRARGSSALARAVYPDLVQGIYSHEELGEPVPGPEEPAPEPYAPEPSYVLDADPIEDDVPTQDPDPEPVPVAVPPPVAVSLCTPAERQKFLSECRLRALAWPDVTFTDVATAVLDSMDLDGVEALPKARLLEALTTVRGFEPA